MAARSPTAFPGAFRILGIAFLVVTVGLAQLLVNPPQGYAPAGSVAVATAAAAPSARDYDWRDMVRTPQFALLWLMYACSAFAGLMIIGHMAKIAAVQMAGLDLGFLLVAVLAIGNALGRVVSGIVSDKIGGIRTMLIVFVTQAVLMGALAFSTERARRSCRSPRRWASATARTSRCSRRRPPASSARRTSA